MNITTLVKPAALWLGAGLALYSSYGLAAKCEYVVQSDWNSGFVAAIRITNDSTTAINGWSVNWSYTDGSRRTGGWNANFSGNNPYTASGVGWNDRINPGQTVEFGIQGNKGAMNNPVQRPTVTGLVCGPTSSLPRTSISSSSRSSSSSSRMTSSSSSFTTTSSSVRTTSSSSSVSSGPNTPPIAVLETTAHGLTVQANARDSRDTDGHTLQHTIDFGDGTVIKYPEAWHTYKEAGDYTVTVTVSDGITENVDTKVVSVQPVAGNTAPIARLTVEFAYQTVRGHARTSYDEEGAPLIYEWDLGDGPFIGTANEGLNVCGSSSSRSASSSPYGQNNRSALLTLTVSDGVLKNTIQKGAGGQCGIVYDLLPRAEFTYTIDGNTLSVDASPSRDETGIAWDFGDGTTATGLKAKHTYAAPGSYTVRLSLSGPSLFSGSTTQTIVIGGGSSVNSSVNSSVPSSSPATSSVISSVYSSQPSSVTSSSTASTTSAISSSVSSAVNVSPVAVVQTADYGLTLHVDARGSTDANGDRLKHTIDFGDGTVIQYPEAWHTYMKPGEYSVTVTVSDGSVQGVKTQVLNLQVGEGNQAPVARLTAVFEYNWIAAYAASSYDEQGVPLTYEWDFGQGAYIGDARVRENACVSSSGASSSAGLVTLTVSDGELKDTIQRRASGSCGGITDILPRAEFIYGYKGYQLTVDASASRDETSFQWDFGDGATGTGLKATHTYTVPGTYTVQLRTTGPSLFSNTTSHTVHIGGYGVSSAVSSIPSSVSSSSRSSAVSSVATSSSRSSVSSPAPSSVPRSSSSSSTAVSSDRSHYNAPRATTAPAIDGIADAVWDRATWAPIDVFWLGTQPNPSAQDYSGRYKALWDEDYLYVLVDVTDDRLYDGVRDPLDRYWEDDTVELFIDENRNGGQHGYNTSAWAYHISTYLDVVDSTTGGAKLLNDHIDARLVSNGSKHLWEMRIRIYGEDYADWKANTPLKLYVGKLMGFSASYIDNDGSPQRESMMGSVDTPGHKNNQGYLDASVFGSMRLVE